MTRISDYLTVAALISGFGVTVLMFRVQREIDVQESAPEDGPQPSRVACADLLVIGAIMISLLLVILPLIMIAKPGSFWTNLATASCSASTVLLAGYPLAILDHYGILPGANRMDPPQNIEWQQGEMLEQKIVYSAAFFAVLAFASSFLLRAH